MKTFHASIVSALPLIALLCYLPSVWNDPNWAPSGGEVQGFIILFITLCLSIVIIFTIFPLVRNKLLKKNRFSLKFFLLATFVLAEISTLAILFCASLYFFPMADIYFYLITPLLVSVPTVIFAFFWWLLVSKLQKI